MAVIPVVARARRIGLVEDHHAMVLGLELMLVEQPDLRVVATAADVDGLLAKTTDLDVVVLDLQLGDGSNPTVNIERLRQAGIETLIHTSGEDPFALREAARAGVLGVVLKSERPEVVIDSVRMAAHGHLVASTEWAAAIDSDPDLSEVQLSPRQRQVLMLYASGEKGSRVATLTGLSPDTVNDYLGRVRLKYAEAGRPAPTKTDLYQRAVEDGWLPIPRRLRRRHP